MKQLKSPQTAYLLGLRAFVTQKVCGNIYFFWVWFKIFLIFTKDNGEEGILGDDCLIDCSKIPMIYCNYETQDIVDITLDDLQVGDEIILTIRSSEIENLQKEDDNKAQMAVEQLQLGTQRTMPRWLVVKWSDSEYVFERKMK